MKEHKLKSSDERKKKYVYNNLNFMVKTQPRSEGRTGGNTLKKIYMIMKNYFDSL